MLFRSFQKKKMIAVVLGFIALLSADVALAGLTPPATPPLEFAAECDCGFLARTVDVEESINTTVNAIAILRTVPANTAAGVAEVFPTYNYTVTESTDWLQFDQISLALGNSTCLLEADEFPAGGLGDRAENNFATAVIATVRIPRGAWTLTVHSNDGVLVRLKDVELAPTTPTTFAATDAFGGNFPDTPPGCSQFSADRKSVV